MNYTTPRDKTCPDCGRTFAAYSPKQKRCPKCQAAHRLSANRAKTKRWYQAHAARPHEERKCEVCGKRFVAARNTHIYCGARCARLAKWADAVAARLDGGKGKAASVKEKIKAAMEDRKRRKAELEKRRAVRLLEAAARKAARKLASERRAAEKRELARRAAERASTRQPASRDELRRQVEYDLTIADATERYEASKRWTPAQRGYARTLAMKELSWRGPVVYV